MCGQISYDFAFLMSQNAVNTIAAQIYTSEPQLFSCSTSGTASGEAFSLSFTVNDAPSFDLSASDAAIAERKRLREQRLRATVEDPATAADIADVARSLLTDRAVMDASPADMFSLVNSVQITVTLGSNPPGTALQFTATLQLTLTTGANGELGITAQSLTLEPNQPPNAPPIDPFTLSVINDNAPAAVLQMANTLLQSITLPVVSILGLNFSVPMLAVMDSVLVLYATLQGASGNPSILGNVPSFGDMGLLISAEALQAAVATGFSNNVTIVANSGSNGGNGFSASYNYSLSFGTPDVTPNGSNLQVTVGLSGTASAKVTFLWVPVEIGYSAYASPTPVAQLTPSIVDDELWITLNSMNTFAVVLTLTGNVGSKIAGALGWLVVEPIAAAAVAIASSMISNLNFKVTTINPITFSTSNVIITAAIQDMAYSSFGQDALLSGQIDITVSDNASAQAPPPQAALAAKAVATDSRLCAGGPAVTIPMLLWDGAAVSQTATGGLYFAGNYSPCGQATITALSDTQLAASGTFAIDQTIDGENINVSGSFTAQITVDQCGNWVASVDALPSSGGAVSYSVDLTAALTNGSPVLSGTLTPSEGGAPVQASFWISSQTAPNPSYVYVYPKLTGSNSQVLPTAYMQFPVPTS